jgi:serine/threonine-protein kinase PpkA
MKPSPLPFAAGSAALPVRYPAAGLAAGMTRLPAQAMRQPSIDGYRIGRMIAEGRAATVYLADDHRRGGKVAIKVLKGSHGDSEAIGRGFAAECAILSSIRHEHVVRVFEHRAVGDPRYLVMEHLEGGTLRDRMRRGIDPGQAVCLLRQAAAGLAEVHRRAVVHRDVKPENFLLRSSGELVLTDFGVAAAQGDTASCVPAGRLVGTPWYAAPEQAQGEPPSAAADVYSLGLVLYELLCGRRPFAGKTVLEALSQHLVAPVPRLPATLTQYQLLIDRMLEKRQQRRLPDADALLQEIQCMQPAAREIAPTPR